jgi:hypothetical protein
MQHFEVRNYLQKPKFREINSITNIFMTITIL